MQSTPRRLIFLLVSGLVLSLIFAAAAGAQSGADLWVDANEADLPAGGERLIVPQRYRTLTLDSDGLLTLLQSAPAEGSEAAGQGSVILTLPLPDGAWARFRLVESPIMAPELAARFPEIRTYAGQGVDDPTAVTRLDWTPLGFHAII
ncbi:MAG: hypothetical protein WA029_04365, partial [Anaerolineae bacterium]